MMTLNLKTENEGERKSEMKKIKQHLRRDGALANGSVLLLSAEPIFISVCFYDCVLSRTQRRLYKCM